MTKGRLSAYEHSWNFGVLSRQRGVSRPGRRHHGRGFYFIGAGVLLALFAFLAPGALRPFQRIWMSLAVLMGWVMTRLILCVLFYGMVTPIAFLARGVRKRFFGEKNGKIESYWVPCEWDKDKNLYEKQY